MSTAARGRYTRVLARLVHIPRELSAAARPHLEPPPEVSAWNARRVHEPLAPWFELTPRSPAVDDRIDGVEPGVAASLETFGGVGGVVPEPLRPAVDQGAVVLGGAAVARGTPLDGGSESARRVLRSQCSVRVRVAATGLASGRQCLLLYSLWAHGGVGVQVLLGGLDVDELVLSEGPDRLAILADVDASGELLLDLWLRVTAARSDDHLGVRGVSGYLL